MPLLVVLGPQFGVIEVAARAFGAAADWISSAFSKMSDFVKPILKALGDFINDTVIGPIKWVIDHIPFLNVDTTTAAPPSPGHPGAPRPPPVPGAPPPPVMPVPAQGQDRNPQRNQENRRPAPPPGPVPVQQGNYPVPAPPPPKEAGGGSKPEPVSPVPGAPYTYQGYGELNWEALAQAESGGNWSMNNGNGFFGGLQFDQATWEEYGGKQFADRADLADKSDQIKVATALYNARKAQPWPANGWLLTATPEQLNQAGLTGSGRQSTSAGTTGRGDYYGGSGYGGGGRRRRGGGYGSRGSGLSQLDEFARSVSGTAYGWGGEGMGSTLQSGAAASATGGLYDCSGFMSDMFAMITGKPYQGDERYFTTTSDFAALGFKPGFVPGAFNIGVTPEHMVGQLPSGVNVEAGGGTGQGATYGGKARGPQQLPGAKMWHMDAGAAGQPGGDYSYDGPGTSYQNPMYTTSQDTMGEQLGKDIVTGMLDIFGFGDIFKSPLDFGVFKIFKGLMGIPGKMFGGGGGGDYYGGDEFSSMADLVPGGGGGAGGSLFDFATGFIPQGPRKGGVDNSFHLNIGQTKATSADIWNTVDSVWMPHARQGLRNQPAP